MYIKGCIERKDYSNYDREVAQKILTAAPDSMVKRLVTSEKLKTLVNLVNWS